MLPSTCLCTFPALSPSVKDTCFLCPRRMIGSDAACYHFFLIPHSYPIHHFLPFALSWQNGSTFMLTFSSLYIMPPDSFLDSTPDLWYAIKSCPVREICDWMRLGIEGKTLKNGAAFQYRLWRTCRKLDLFRSLFAVARFSIHVDLWCKILWPSYAFTHIHSRHTVSK